MGLSGCKLKSLDFQACADYLAWLIGETEPSRPEEVTGLVWALAHCDDGVTWGRYDDQAKTWRLGNQVSGNGKTSPSPPIRRETLQELRLFGEECEILIWRMEGDLRGRLIRETDPPVDRDDKTNPLRPADEFRILLGNFVIAPCQHSFTHVGDQTGTEQVLPIVVDKKQLQSGQVGLVVSHYYEQGQETGIVRIAATRLVRLTTGGADER